MAARTTDQRKYDPKFGAYVRKLRLKKFPKVSGRKFAAELGMTGPYLSNIELSKVPPPSVEKVLDLAAKLDIPRYKLLGMAGYIDPELAELFIDAPPETYQLMVLFNKMLASDHVDFSFQDMIYLIFAVAVEKGGDPGHEAIGQAIGAAIATVTNGGKKSEELKARIEKGAKAAREIAGQEKAKSNGKPEE